MPAAVEERPNKVEIKDAGPCLKKITIEVPAETVNERLNGSFSTLATQAQIPGFRKGRAPAALIERQFGAAVRKETKEQLVASAYQQVVEEHKLKVLGDPSSESLESIEVQPGKPLKFELEVEVAPEFTVPGVEGIAVLKPLFDVTDEFVDTEIKKICVHEGTLEERQAPEPGDYLTGHAVMVGDKDGHEFYNLKGAVVQVPPPDREGKGMILGIMVDNFAKQLGLPKPGETATIKTKGPENHELESVRGAPLTITFAVDRCDRIIPAPIADVVKSTGWGDEQQLREAVRNRLRQRVMIDQQVAMRRQIADYLTTNTTMELPERTTAAQTARIVQQQRLELMYRGFEPNQIEEHLAQLRNTSSEAAVRELKLFFILNAVADQLNIRVSENEIKGRIVQMAQERNVRPEKLQQELAQTGQMMGLFRQIREHKAMDAILAKANVSEVSADEYHEKMKAAKG